MQFKDRNDAHHYFSFYGFLAGFEVVTTHTSRTTSRKRNGEIFKVEMKCNKHGKQQNDQKKEEQPIPTLDVVSDKGPKRNTNVQIKTNCLVVMVVKEENGIWTIICLELDHNHDLSPGNRNKLFSVSDPGTRDYARGVLFLGYGMGHGSHPLSVVTTRSVARLLIQ
jgi:hypothetical protein